jgi:chemotaxis protein MotB
MKQVMQQPSVSEPFKPVKRRGDAEEDWLITFADVSTLLLCFFIILFAVSHLEPTQRSAFSAALEAQGFQASASTSDDPYEQLVKETLELNHGQFEQVLFVTQKSRKLHIELAASAFFASGSAKFKPSALKPLAAIAEKLLPFLQDDVQLTVEGHTDDVPIATAQYPSNWELSSARASNVVRYLITQGMPANRLAAAGFADTQPKAENLDITGNPIAANRELNRRVVITLERRGKMYQ